jgi:hypothetical protein
VDSTVVVLEEVIEASPVEPASQLGVEVSDDVLVVVSVMIVAVVVATYVPEGAVTGSDGQIGLACNHATVS